MNHQLAGQHVTMMSTSGTSSADAPSHGHLHAAVTLLSHHAVLSNLL